MMLGKSFKRVRLPLLNSLGFYSSIAINKVGTGNKLIRLGCPKKAAADENMHRAWSGIDKALVSFLENLPEDMRSVGRKLADLYGRYNPDKFRPFDRLRAGSEPCRRRCRLILCQSVSKNKL